VSLHRREANLPWARQLLAARGPEAGVARHGHQALGASRQSAGAGAQLSCSSKAVSRQLQLTADTLAGVDSDQCEVRLAAKRRPWSAGFQNRAPRQARKGMGRPEPLCPGYPRPSASAPWQHRAQICCARQRATSQHQAGQAGHPGDLHGASRPRANARQCPAGLRTGTLAAAPPCALSVGWAAPSTQAGARARLQRHGIQGDPFQLRHLRADRRRLLGQLLAALPEHGRCGAGHRRLRGPRCGKGEGVRAQLRMCGRHKRDLCCQTPAPQPMCLGGGAHGRCRRAHSRSAAARPRRR